MKKKAFIIIILPGFLLSGCWDQRELSSISVVTGMAIDKGKNGKYKLSVEGINAQELNSKTAMGYAPSVIFSLEGNTLSELSQKLNTGLSRMLIYSHMRTFIISDEAASDGMMEFIDYLERNREIRDDFNILVARNNKAENILKITYPLQKSASLKLYTQLQSMVHNWGGDPNVRLNDVVSAWRSPGRQPVMAAVTITGKKRKQFNVENMRKEKPDAMIVLDSLAIFKNGKLKGFLPITDSRNYLWIEDRLTRTSMSVPCGKDRFVGMQIYNSKTRTKAKALFGRPVIDLTIRSEAYIDGVQCKDDLSKVETYKKYERLAEKTIEKGIHNTIDKVQHRYQADIFGFGEDVMRQDYQNFKKLKSHWDASFSDADINVHVKVNLRRSGIRTRSILK